MEKNKILYYLQKGLHIYGCKFFFFLRDNKNNSVNQTTPFLVKKKMEINKRFGKVNEFATAECNILSV